ncbi:schlafen family member 13-like [Glandiceps talaboti]
MSLDCDSKNVAEKILVTSLKDNPSKKEREKQTRMICNQLCALANSGGGIVKIENKYKEPFDNWLKNIQMCLEKALEPQSWDNCFTLEGTHESPYVFIFVKKSLHVLTVDTECYGTSDTEVKQKNTANVKEVMKKPTPNDDYIQCPIQDLQRLPKSLKFGQPPEDLCEREQVQFKDINKDSNLMPMIGKNISGFANTKGGHLMLGVKEERKKYKVTGRCLNADSKETLERDITEEVGKMEWGFPPEMGKHWSIQYIPVVGSTCGCNNHVVVVISVAKIAGSKGVYRRQPKSYYVDGDGEMKEREFDAWKEEMMKDREIDNLTKELQKYKLVGNGRVLTLEDSIDQIRDGIFEAKDGVKIWPTRTFFDQKDGSNNQDVFCILEEYLKENKLKGVAVCVKSLWDVVFKEKRPEDHTSEKLVCDILLCIKEKGLFLLTVCNGEDEKIRKYNLEMGKCLKSKLATIGDCIEWFAIHCHVLDTTAARSSKEMFRQNRFYPAQYQEMSTEKYISLTTCLTLLLSAVQTPLATKIGCSFLNTLTPEQFNLLWESYEEQRILWIKGPAGTGKTLIAFELMKKLQKEKHLNREEIMYVTQYNSILWKAAKTGACEAMTLTQFVKKSVKCDKVKHIILDGAQNFEEKTGGDKWFPKAQEIVERSNGYLWIFIDYAQKLRHTTLAECGLPGKRAMQPCKTLTKIIRNASEIFNYIQENGHFGDEYKNVMLRVPHNFAGTKPLVHYYREGMLQAKLFALLDLLTSRGYSYGDIAILTANLDKRNKLEEELFRQSQYPVMDEQADENNIALASIRRFSELERPVVIGIDPDTLTTGGQTRRRVPSQKYHAHMLLLCSRAMAELILLKKSQY